MTTDLIRVEYAQNGKSKSTDSYGMREMQARAFASRDHQYLLLKAPPASGKSRALMFLALDKLINQGIRKAIVAVPETSIGASFDPVALSENGFFADWEIAPENNLCTVGSDASTGKIDTFRRFMLSDSTEIKDRILICTHATLRFAFQKLEVQDFNDTVLAIDEFHHASADGDNQLGNLLEDLMKHSTAHIVAMTGSYFRGDTVPILLPEDEAQFDKVTYTYYEQLNGYEYLKSLGIGYHFYQGRYIDAIQEVLDPDKKTIIHIPNVNSRESTKDKLMEVDEIIDALGDVQKTEPDTGMVIVKTKSGKHLRVANLVDDNKGREKVQQYLRNAENPEDVDIIIALGMAKEGFDWPFCEHVLTIGYRNSMTEVVQIIGRATRDAPGKHHAQFTNLVAQPDAEDEDVKYAVNNMLKAITVSLLMEQVMAPTFNFKPRQDSTPDQGPGTIDVDGIMGGQSSERAQKALEESGDDIMATFVNDKESAASMVGVGKTGEELMQLTLTSAIQQHFPDMTEDEVEQTRRGIATQMAIRAHGGLYSEEELPENAEIVSGQDEGDPQNQAPTIVPKKTSGEDGTASEGGSKQFIRLSEKFVNIDDLNMDLIDSVNPFQGAYEIISKSLDSSVLKAIQHEVAGTRTDMTEDEATVLWPKIQQFVKDHQREPDPSSSDPVEKRYGECLSWLRAQKRKQTASGA